MTGEEFHPLVRKFDGSASNVATTLVAHPTAERVQSLPDKSGDLLMLNDIYVPRALNILATEPFTVDWGLSSDFLMRLTKNSHIFFANSKEGQRISVFVQNSGTAYAVEFPFWVFWPNGIQPAMPTSQAGRNHQAEYRFVNINGNVYGELYEVVTLASPTNTVFVGGTTTDTGKEPSGGFHVVPGSISTDPL